MFDRDQVVADCRAALDSNRASRNVWEVMARAVADPAGVMRALGEPRGGGFDVLYRSPELTILPLR